MCCDFYINEIEYHGTVSYMGTENSETIYYGVDFMQIVWQRWQAFSEREKKNHSTSLLKLVGPTALGNM